VTGGHRRTLVALLAGSLAGGSLVGPAAADDEPRESDRLQVDVRASDLDEDGQTELIVNVSGPAKPDELEADAFRVREGLQDMSDLDVTPLLELDTRQIVTVLSIDASRSMEGEPLEEVRTAAADLVETFSDAGIQMGLHRWSNEAESLVEPTTQSEPLIEAIDGIEAVGRTALFDAAIFGIEELQGLDDDAVRSLVLLADGEDNESEAEMEDAIGVAQDAGIPITVVAFETDVLDFDALRPLADETGGRFIMAAGDDTLDAALAEVASDVGSQYVVTYDSAVVEPGDLDITVLVETDGVRASTSFVVPNPRGEEARPELVAVEPFDPGPFGTPLALYTMVALAFVAALLFLVAVLVPRGDPAVARALRRGITMVTRAPTDAPRTSGLTASAIGQRTLEAIDALPKPEGYDEKLQDRIDRAGWQLRASELNALRLVGSVTAGAWVWAITGSVLLGLISLVIGAVAPTLAVLNAAQRRQTRFMELLPDTLQLLSGSLRAGYGVLQAIDTVVKESEPPMSAEFQRVLTEARLGLPLEDALAGMAERVDNDDFRWVVVAMNIQRRVGGNLAELLDTVSGTLRSRDQVRRQVKVLSAEGRLSAAVLVALPFVILTFLLFVNPSYLQPLFTDPLGLLLVVGSGLLMLVGVLWMRRLIRIDV
jgi:tight adherence protein B